MARNGTDPRRKLWAGVAVSLLVGVLALPAAAQALSAPEVFLQELDASNLPTGGWVPLAGAHMRSVNGYEVGVRLQDTGHPDNTQRILIQATSVPDGHPDQRDIYSLCFAHSGSAGEITDPDERVLYEGDGAYTLSVTVSAPGPDFSTDCAAGPTTTGSFTAAADTVVRFAGHMIITDPSRHHAFGGLQLFPTVGAGATDVQCARDPRPAPGGTLTGSLVINRELDGSQASSNQIDAGGLFEQPGRWACIGRSTGGGDIPGPWSPATATEAVQTGFYPVLGSLRLSEPRGPRFRLTERFLPAARGGTVRVVLRRTGRRARPIRLKARVGRSGQASLGFRLPALAATGPQVFYTASVSFAGTRLVAARAPFRAFAFSAIPTGHGRADIEFPPPCRPHRC